MVLNFSLKLINNICIAIGAVLSVLAIAIASLSIFFIINTSIKIDDNNKFLTNLISWYYNKSISFEYIKVDRVLESYSFFIEINGFKIDKYENYKNIEVDNIKFNINLSNFFNNKYYMSNVAIKNPNITYNSLKSLQESNQVVGIFDTLLKNIGDLNVYNGTLTYIHKDTKYFLSKINFNKNGLTNIDILGDFLYKNYYIDAEAKKFTFKVNKALNNFNISINFYELSLPDFIHKKLNNSDKYSINGLYSGVIIFNFAKKELTNLQLILNSDNTFIELKKPLLYDNFTINSIPNITNLSLNLSYNFKTSNLNINNLILNLQNNSNMNSEVIFLGDIILDNSYFKINYVFNNIFINDYISAKNQSNNFFLKNFFSGKGNFSISNNSLDKLKLIVNNATYNEVNFSDIIINHNNITNTSNIAFSLDGKHSNLLSFNKAFNILDYDYLNYFSKKDIEAYHKLNVSIKYNDISENYNNFIIIVDGYFSAINTKKIYLNNNIFLNNLNYNISIKNNNINIDGLADINDSIINFNFLKSDISEMNLKFNLNDQIFSNYSNLSNLKGSALVDCKINRKDKIDLYSCNINLINSLLSFPNLNYVKDYSEEASLSINGIFSNNLLYDNINFNFIHEENLLGGYLKLDDMLDGFYINFKKFIFNKNDLQLEILYKNKFLDINLLSGAFNLVPLYSNINSNNMNSNIISLNGNLDKIIIFENFELDNTKIISKNIYKNININSTYDSVETINFSIDRTKNSEVFSYNFMASNAGKFFNLLNYRTEIQDGILSSQGFIGSLDDDNDIMGTLSIDNFKIMKAPLFAKLLLAASLSGLFEVFNNEGVSFDQFDAQFTKNNNIIKINKSRAYGFSLGLTGEGSINMLDKSIQIDGSIVPAYTLNTIFNDLPIIGELLSGKEDEGIFAFNYSANGNWVNPDIQVNPLSIFTPGIMRNLFD